MKIRRRGFFGAVAAVFCGAPLAPAVAKYAVATSPAPGAITIPFATLPFNTYIRGPRYRVMFDRVMPVRGARCVDKLFNAQVADMLRERKPDPACNEVRGDGFYRRIVPRLPTARATMVKRKSVSAGVSSS